MKTLPILVAATLLLYAAPSLAAEADHSLEATLAEMASTPQQHAALAHHYEAKAEEARAQATRHEQMANTYGGGKARSRAKFKQHCDNLAQNYTVQAKEYDSLSALHQAQAGQ